MTPRCARCDWTGDDLVAHAVEAGHPLCAVDGQRSLVPAERAVCIHCEGRVARAVVYLRRSWPELSTTLAVPATQRLSAGGGRSSGTTVPGGLGAVLRGGGRSWRWAAPATDPRVGMAHRDDERPGEDGPSVVAELTYWTVDFADRLGTDLPWRLGGGPAVVPLLEYLGARVRWAAAANPRFAEFAADVRSLEGWARRSIGEVEGPLRDSVACVDCSTTDGPVWLVREEDPRGRGWSDDPVCPRCRRSYGEVERNLAAAELLRRQAVA